MILSKIFNTHKGSHSYNLNTICEMHRQIYDNLFVGCANNDWSLVAKSVPILEQAYICGIKLCKKLVENKLALPEWSKNDSPEAKRLRSLRNELMERLNEARTDIRSEMPEANVRSV